MNRGREFNRDITGKKGKSPVDGASLRIRASVREISAIGRDNYASSSCFHIRMDESRCVVRDTGRCVTKYDIGVSVFNLFFFLFPTLVERISR